MGASAKKTLTPDEIELQWFHNHYRGDMKQLTLRAVLMGGALGAVLSLTNLYIGLKTGWGFGVAITACVLSFSIWTGLRKIGLVGEDMTILENNAMQSTASSAGYSTGGTLVSAIAAYLLITGEHIPYGLLTAWIFFLAVLGVTLAIPMKRQMINVERLRFPSGIAAAMTLRSLHGDHDHKPALQGPVAEVGLGDEDEEKAEEAALKELEEAEGGVSSAEEGTKSARALFVSAGLASLLAFVRDGFDLLKEIGVLGKTFFSVKFAYPVFGDAALKATVGMEGSLLLVAGGALMGIRVAASVMIGSVLCWLVFVPLVWEQGIIHNMSYNEAVKWALWGGASCMVTSGLLAFAMQWRSVARALSGVTDLFASKENKKAKPPEIVEMEKVEVPASWFLAGALVGGAGVVSIAFGAFAMPIWMGLLAVVLSFFLALVACRVAGETDTTPVGAMGKVTQLMYGAITPKTMRINAPKTAQEVNLMAACITAGVADSASDLLIDLKSGYVLGANPRKQFLAQFCGIFVGTAVTVPVFYLLVPDASALGTDKWPAPAAQVWASVARLLAQGWESLPKYAAEALIIGGLVGIVLAALPRLVPKKVAKWVPSPMGIGLAFTFHFYYGLSMFLGGLIAWGFATKWPKKDKLYTFPVASGVIAGEALMGVAVAIASVLLL